MLIQIARRWLFLAFALVLLYQGAVEGQEPNNDFASATVLPGGLSTGMQSLGDGGVGRTFADPLLGFFADPDFLVLDSLDDNSGVFGNGQGSMIDGTIPFDGIVPLSVTGTGDEDFNGFIDGLGAQHSEEGLVELILLVWDGPSQEILVDTRLESIPLGPGDVFETVFMAEEGFPSWADLPFTAVVDNTIEGGNDIDVWRFTELPANADFRVDITSEGVGRGPVVGHFESGAPIPISNNIDVFTNDVIPFLEIFTDATGDVVVAATGWDDFEFIGAHSDTQEYALNLYLIGDSDGDLDVDGSDVLSGLLGFGISDDGGREQGDTDGDGDVDRADLLRTLDNYGAGAVMEEVDPLEQLAVPEPATWLLAVFAGLGFVMGSQRWGRAAIATAGCCMLAPSIGFAADRPNVVFILVDDLGVMDIGAYNPNTFYETPNVDKLAATGMRFTNGYAANPVCSPTRYSIMTGKYPSRVDATNWFSGKRKARFAGAPFNDVMPLEEVTLAEALREGGYQTAFLGKWHLGPTAEYWPKAQGFQINVGGHHRGSPPGGYFAPYNNPRLESGPDGEHLTTRLTDEAIRILNGFAQEESPFLLYLSFYTVHTPLQAPKDLVDKYERKAAALPPAAEFAEEEQVWPTDRPRRVRIEQRHSTYAAMIETMDTSVGRVLDRLDELGVAENTIVCFMSDNGGLSTSEGSPTSNLPLRGGKGWTYEGGIREPYLIRWPGHTKPGSTSDTPVISTDFYPTLLAASELPLRPEQHLDGKSLVSVLEGDEETLAERPLYWHYPHYANQGGFPGGAIRIGDWKLHERFEDGRLHLYNIVEDVGEQRDVAKLMPQRVEKMREMLHEWYKEVDAKFLQPLPDGPMPWRPGNS